MKLRRTDGSGTRLIRRDDFVMVSFETGNMNGVCGMLENSKKNGAGARPSQSLAGLRIANSLRELILSGRMEPGSRVRQEDIADDFGLSRIPVREALRILENEGLVVLKPNSGAWIARLDKAECVEIYKIREQLEPLAITESCSNLDASTIDELQALADEMQFSEDKDAFLRLDRVFHLRSYSAAGLPQLLQLIHRYWNCTQQYRRAFTGRTGQGGMKVLHFEHQLIVDALRRRDGEQAGRVLQGHIRRTRLNLESESGIFS